MEPIHENLGRLNPNAPPNLSLFAFLIGRWECEAKLKVSETTWQTFRATWTGRFVLDGYAIADEYRMTSAAGDLIVLGMNLRSYDPAKEVWNIKWLNAMSGTWTDLTSEYSDGVHIHGADVSYSFKEPLADQMYTRATYGNISKDHFTWSGEKSDDGVSWSDFMLVECHRTDH